MIRKLPNLLYLGHTSQYILGCNEMSKKYIIAESSGEGSADVTCSPIMCFMYCPSGFKVDDNGCDLCECSDEMPENQAQGM